MSRIAYVNGHYRNLRDACVNIEDRGYQFSDGVYEVCEIRDGRLVERLVGALPKQEIERHLLSIIKTN